MNGLSLLRKEIIKTASPARAKASLWFFKTVPGQYGHGDKFIGLTSPQMRLLVKKYSGLAMPDIMKLFHSAIHEERQIALLILVSQFAKSGDVQKKKIYDLYLANTKYINNWDLVDLTAPRIVGEYLRTRPRKILYKLARSRDLWEKRIAIMSTFQFIYYGEYEDAFRISDILLKDEHDLIHKAVGWMLREVGKRISQVKEEEFLKKHYRQMPRTMLRYAIERFPESLRKKYLLGKI